MYDATARTNEGRTKAADRSGPEPSEALLRDLEGEARASVEREAYRELVRLPACRLGVTVAVRGPRSVRFLVDVLLDRWAQAPAIAGALSRRGYVSTRLDDGWVAYERAVARARLAAEWRFLRGLVEGS